MYHAKKMTSKAHRKKDGGGYIMQHQVREGGGDKRQVT